MATSNSLAPSRRSDAVKATRLGPREGRDTDEVHARELEMLAHEIQACRRCRLGSIRTQAVVYRGGAHPRVLFIGEAPGAEEDRLGLPFVGRAGRRLDGAIARLGLAETEFGIANLLKCRPPANRFDPRAAATCRTYLDQQVALLDPLVLVTLGSHALRAFAPEALPITASAGIPRRWGDRVLVPLLHPAAAMHSPRYRSRWEDDISRLATLLPELLREAL